MSSLVTDNNNNDNNNKRQKSDNTGEKDSFTDNSDIESYISSYVLPTDSVEPMFRIEFKFETPQNQIDNFYSSAINLVQQEKDWNEREDVKNKTSHYSTFKDEMLSEYEGAEEGYNIDDFVVQCSMFEKCTISLTLTDVGVRRIQYDSYNNLFNTIRERVYTSVRQNGNRYDAVPFTDESVIIRDNNENITHAEYKIVSVSEDDYNDSVQATRGFELLTTGRATTLSNYKKPKKLFLDPMWDNHNYESYEDFTAEFDSDYDSDDPQSMWLGQFVDVSSDEYDKLVEMMGDGDEPQVINWDVVLRYNCLYHDAEDVSDIENQRLQAVLHDIDDDDEFMEDNGGITSINTSNWCMGKKRRFVDLINNIRRDVDTFYNGTIQIDVDTNFNQTLRFNNGNIGEPRRPLIYAFICSGPRLKTQLTKYHKEIDARFYKDNINLKF